MTFDPAELFWQVLERTTAFDYSTKQWYIGTLAFWLSSSIRNLQLLLQRLAGVDNDYTLTPLIYLASVTYAYFSGKWFFALTLSDVFLTARN